MPAVVAALIPVVFRFSGLNGLFPVIACPPIVPRPAPAPANAELTITPASGAAIGSSIAPDIAPAVSIPCFAAMFSLRRSLRGGFRVNGLGHRRGVCGNYFCVGKSLQERLFVSTPRGKILHALP